MSAIHLQGLTKKFAAIPEAQVFPFAPPPVPGYGNAGGFTFELQDRSWGSIEKLVIELKRSLDAARKRPELANLYTGFRAEVPQVWCTPPRTIRRSSNRLCESSR